MGIRGRDNARTPMQWDSSFNAGFSDENAKTWLKVNPNKDTINVEAQQYDDNSVLNFYRSVIYFRKNNNIIKNGTYTDLMPKSKSVYVYERKLDNKSYIIMCNFKKKNVKLDLKDIKPKKSFIKFQNYDKCCFNFENQIELRPFECLVYELEY